MKFCKRRAYAKNARDAGDNDTVFSHGRAPSGQAYGLLPMKTQGDAKCSLFRYFSIPPIDKEHPFVVYYKNKRSKTEVRRIENCHSCGEELPVDALCYRIEGRLYCPRCIAEAACFADEERMEAAFYEGFAAHWEVRATRQRGGFTERIVSPRDTLHPTRILRQKA